MIGGGIEFGSFENAKLFEKFFGFTKDGARIQEASEQIGNSAKEVSTFFSEAAEGTESVKSTLS